MPTALAVFFCLSVFFCWGGESEPLALGFPMVIGIGLLSVATKALPLEIAYAVWTGLGTLFTATSVLLSSGKAETGKESFVYH